MATLEDALGVVIVEVGGLFEVVMAVLGLTVRVRRVVIAHDDVKRRRQALWVASPHVMSYGRDAGGQQLSQRCDRELSVYKPGSVRGKNRIYSQTIATAFAATVVVGGVELCQVRKFR